MPSTRSGSTNGGIIGASNKSSFGLDTITSKTSTGTVTTQPGTRVVQTLIIAGGGGGGSAAGSSNQGGAGGGAGGYLCTEINVCGSTSYSLTVGAGAASTPSGPNDAASGSNSTFSTLATAIGGGAGEGRASPIANGIPGGSGGGGQNNQGGCGTTGQGNPGGGAPVPSTPPARCNFGPGGGGGAAAAGSVVT